MTIFNINWRISTINIGYKIKTNKKVVLTLEMKDLFCVPSTHQCAWPIIKSFYPHVAFYVNGPGPVVSL